MRPALLRGCAAASVSVASARGGSRTCEDRVPEYERAYEGELTPRARVGTRWQRGPYASWFLRLSGVSDEALGDLLDESLSRASAASAAAFVASPQRRGLSSDAVEALLSRGFRFHHYSEDDEFVYYAWCGAGSDMVPAYATSIEGVSAVLVFGTKVLFVWEYGRWRAPSGAVEPGESTWTTLVREVKEEVGLDIHEGTPPVYVGGYHEASARDKRINDTFSAFGVRVESDDFTVDDKEITCARWFDIADLLAVARDVHAESGPAIPLPPQG